MKSAVVLFSALVFPTGSLCANYLELLVKGSRHFSDSLFIQQGLLGDALDANVILTTALNASKHVMGTFREGCEAYPVKPFKNASSSTKSNV